MDRLEDFQVKAISEIKDMLKKARELHEEYYKLDAPNTSTCYHCPLSFGLPDRGLCLWETLEAINDEIEEEEEDAQN